jgi:iron complex outermembrane receptor protein
MREDFKRKQNELRVALGFEQARPQANASWTYADSVGALDYTVTGSLHRREQADDTQLRTLGTDAQGTPNLAQGLHSGSRNWHDGAMVSTRLRWRDARDTLELTPYLSTGHGQTTGTSQLQQTLGNGAAPYDTANWTSESRNTMARLAGSWLHRSDEGARWQLRFGGSLAESDASTLSQQWSALGQPLHLRSDDAQQHDTSFNLSGKVSQLVAERHSLVAGWELQTNQRSDRRVTLDNGVQQLAAFGDEVQARTLRLAGYVQDEWEASKAFGFNAGLRWEGIATRSDSALQQVRHLSSVVTPLLHMVWRLPDRPRDQLRLSLTRSYRSPSTAQLIGRPRLSSLYPADGPNQPTSPDRAGNPGLKPELARGLDLALEHYLEAGGIVSANVFVRRIDHLIRTVRTLQDVSWSPVQRWVAAPQNIGGALASGLELEAKFRAADLWATTLPLTLRTNASILRSRVDQVPGPNNRLDQQPGYTANIGFDYSVRGWPLTLGGNLNFTPQFTVQQIDSQSYRQGVKRVLDAYALWRFSPAAQLRLSLSNLGPRDYDSATLVTLDDGSTQTQDTLARTYLVANLRLELRF